LARCRLGHGDAQVRTLPGRESERSFSLEGSMAQHFLLSAQARTLSLKEIYQAGEDAAYATFRKLRWPATGGSPQCPRCGCAKVYEFSTRRKFKCAACHHQFSVTSGTIFACRKLAFVDLLAAICLFANAAKGSSALQLSRDLDVQYKTAFVLAHKLREALAAETAKLKLGNSVEVDGAYFCGHVRPANRKTDRVDRRLLQNRTDKRRVVMALRQRSGRTLTRSFRLESDGITFARERIVEGSVVAADDLRHWDVLASSFRMQRIDHSEAYSLDGAHTNLAESYFARLRRMIRGQHHRVEPAKLDAYAAHAGWLEDHRRQSNGELADRLMRSVFAASVSGTWSGYWQRAA
jgi:transposase-like protein